MNNKLIKSSRKWRLNLWDLLQGAILAVLSGVTGYLIQSLVNMDLTEIHWNVVGTPTDKQ